MWAGFFYGNAEKIHLLNCKLHFGWKNSRKTVGSVTELLFNFKLEMQLRMDYQFINYIQSVIGSNPKIGVSFSDRFCLFTLMKTCDQKFKKTHPEEHKRHYDWCVLLSKNMSINLLLFCIVVDFFFKFMVWLSFCIS